MNKKTISKTRPIANSKMSRFADVRLGSYLHQTHVASVARGWNKKLPKISRNWPKSSYIIFIMKVTLFEIAPNRHQNIWATFV